MSCCSSSPSPRPASRLRAAPDPLSGTWGGRAPGSCAEKSKDKFTDHDAEEEAEVEAELGFGDEEDDKENARPAVEHVGHAGLMDVDVEVDGVEKVSPADVNAGAERDGAGDVSLMDIAAGGHCEPVGATASGAPLASAWPDDDEFWFPQESDSDDSDWDDDDDDDDEDDDFGGLGIRIDLPIAGVACETGAGAAAHGVLAALAGTEGEGVLMLDVSEAGVRLTGTLGQLAASKAAQAFRPMGGAAEGVLVGRSVGPRAVRTTNVVVGGVHAGCGRLAGAAARRGVAPRGAASGSAKSAWRDRGNGADTLAVAGERTPGRTPVVEAGDALMGKAVARGGGRSEGRDAGWRPVGGDEMDVQDADWSLIGGECRFYSCRCAA